MLAPLMALHLALAAGPAPSTLSAPEAMAQGLKNYRDANFEDAIPLFQRAALPDDDKKAKASALVWLGLSFLNIGNGDLARQSFRAALLADPGTKLPDEAPPAATPMFATIKGELERSAPRAPTDVARPKPPETKHADVPEATASNEKPDKSIAPDLTANDNTDGEVSSESHFPRTPGWVPQVVVGTGAAVLLGAGYFKLSSNSHFNDAASAATAAQAGQLSHTADHQQHVARTLAITGVLTLAAGTALYLLNE